MTEPEEQRTRRRVPRYTRRFVLGFLWLPTVPFMFWVAGYDDLESYSIPGLIAIALACWAAALTIGWKAGGRLYPAGAVANALLALTTIPWLVATTEYEDVPHGGMLTRLLVVTALLWASAVLIRWRFDLWPFNRE